MTILLPRLRFIEVYPVQSNGTKVFCLRDPEGYQEDPVFLSPEACLVAVMLDGNSTIKDIQQAFTQSFPGQKISEKDIEEVIRTLDECLLLQTQHFVKQKSRLDAAFTASRVRDPYLAGKGYPRDPDKLKAFLDKFYRDPKGPGDEPAKEKAGKPLAGLLIPHIDFYRGGWCYAHAYKALAESKPPKRILLLGVAHAGSPKPFVFCNKSFRTPFGEMPLDEESAAEIKSRLGEEVFEHEMLHRTEHSLEFQAVWLNSLYAGRERPMILPVLVSSFGAEKPGGSPVSVENVERVIEALSQMYTDTDSLVLAGVDLAHVGPRFGDTEPLTETLAERTRLEDQSSLDFALKSNAQGFWNSVVNDGNKRKVCGLSAIYTALRVLGKRKGDLLAYGQALDPAGGIVSFASVRFSR